MGKINLHPTCGQNIEFISKTYSQTSMHNLGKSKDQTKPKKATKSKRSSSEGFFVFIFVLFFCFVCMLLQTMQTKMQKKLTKERN